MFVVPGIFSGAKVPTIPLVALEQLRLRIRTRHYSYRTESTCVDWAHGFFDYEGPAGRAGRVFCDRHRLTVASDAASAMTAAELM